MIPIYLNKQQVFDADSKAIQQINFTENLEKQGQTAMCFITEDEKKKNILDFS